MTLLLVCVLGDASFSPSISTGKERDTESGNDYFGARYYASSMGRFTSPDPSGLYFADASNPQSFNLYSYALNNPLTNVDPTGLYCIYYGDTDENLVGSSIDAHSDQSTCEGSGPGGGGKWVDDPTATVEVNGDDGSSSIDVENVGFDGTMEIVDLQHFDFPGGYTPPADPCTSRNGRPYGPGHRARDYHLPANGTSIPAPEDGSITGGRSNAPHIPGPYNYSQAAKPGTTNYTDFTGDTGNIIRYVHTHPAVPMGASVNQGQTMATSDMSGRTTAPHTHVQVTNPNGVRIDPNTYFSGCH
jgi:RHS repeat-associated protein